MLDRIDPQRRGAVDRLGAVRMRRDLHAQRMGGGHHRRDFAVGHQRVIGIVVARQHPAARHDLDQIGALAVEPADRRRRLLRPVDDGVAPMRVIDLGIEPVARIAVAAGRTERRARHDQARAFDQPGFDRGLQAHRHRCGRTEVADRGEAGTQHGAVARHGRISRIDRPLRDLVDDRIAAERPRQMDVGVDQAGHHGPGRQVDDLRAGRGLKPRLDGGDAIVADDDDILGERRARRRQGGGDEHGGAEQRKLHSVSPVKGRNDLGRFRLRTSSAG